LIGESRQLLQQCTATEALKLHDWTMTDIFGTAMESPGLVKGGSNSRAGKTTASGDKPA